jgi:hypothetical protein
VCYRNLGVALTDVGPLKDALDAYRSAAKIREGLVEQYPSNVRYQRRLEVTYVDMGRVLGSEGGMGDPATAAVYMTKAREIAERLAKLDSSNNQAKEDLGGVYQNIGQVQSGLNPPAAVDWFLRSVAISRELLEISPKSSITVCRSGFRNGRLQRPLAGPIGYRGLFRMHSHPEMALSI